MKTIVLLLLLAAPFALSACGDGWQVVYTKDVSAFSDGRTAGGGVVYIRKLMPAKSLRIEPASVVAQRAPEDSKLHKAFKAFQSK